MLLNGTGRLRVRHLKILIWPAVITVLVLLVWYKLRLHGFYQSKNDADATTNSLIPLLGAFHAIAAGFILYRVMEEDGKLHECVEQRDILQLRRELKKRIHPLVHILMSVFATFIIAATTFCPYDSVWSGIEHVGFTTFGLSLLWMIVLALDNPLFTPWIREVIPDDINEEIHQLSVYED